ncbi:MAG: hypothetical protein AVO35_11200 [Candidatus Aegiribacteria sp. MLS_C]|nr:MAG: hypothetical protein AVO35_11200 [Candidatus Aegiribacteria sp. MLS_C]
MTGVEIILAAAFAGALLTWFIGRTSSTAGSAFAVAVLLALTALVALLHGRVYETVFYRGFLGLPMSLRTDSLSWFFAMATTVLAALSGIFSLSYMKDRKNTGFFNTMLLLVNAAMLGVVFSGDLLSFFIFWEIMSWSTFLLISFNRGQGVNAGLKYIVMSLVGSMAMLVGIGWLLGAFGTLNIARLSELIPSASGGHQLVLLLLFGIAFGIKNAVMPLHTWLPDAYTEAPSPFTAVLSGMLTRMGIFGFLLILYVMAGAARVLHSPGSTVPTYNVVLAWLGAVTIVVPTFIAMLQNDAKRLLAWHGIGQGGYMILGMAFGTGMGLAGGIFHTLNHAIYIVLLFMSVGAVQHRTGGVRDLNSLGGLARKMPVAFIGALMGISGLIGVPLTNGFVSKWMIYRTLILGGAPFLAFAALIGSWGTILSVYKFLHNVFLGQLPSKYENVRSSPVSMKIPILVLSFAILLFGILPGLPLKVIDGIVVSFGLPSLDVSLWGIASEAGTLNTVNLFAALAVGVLVVLAFVRILGRSERVGQDSNYSAGCGVPRDRYNYTARYYDPLFRMISPYLKDFFSTLYDGLARGIGSLCEAVRMIYTGYVSSYVMYILLFISAMIFIHLTWNPW